MRGTCKLTELSGKFVKSHILPRALSDKNLDQIPRIQWGERGARPSLRYTSWYDDKLVAEQGEAKLAQIDEKATAELRRLGLCWRYFPISPLAKRTPLEGFDFEIIEFEDSDVAALRMFFLSLLWRAAASRRHEFREIRLDVDSLRKLRKIVNGEIAPHPSDFPITLTLLTTKGQPQNLAPLRQRMAIPQLCEGLKRDVKIFRFYLDGLIAHVGRKSMDLQLADAWGRRSVGSGKDLFVLGRAYEGSFQEWNLNTLQDELERTWPDETKRILQALENVRSRARLNEVE